VQTINKYPALEVLNADGEWIKLYPQEGCFVVNLADMMMRMTNDTFVSTVHRVINRGETDRYSIPFFFGANANELIEVLPTCTSEENPAKYAGMTTFDVSRLHYTYPAGGSSFPRNTGYYYCCCCWSSSHGLLAEEPHK
jgi:isopenicillin N synthase-like dioxygenase